MNTVCTSVVYPFKGTRVELIITPHGFQRLKPGEYGKWKDGTWHGCAPDGNPCNLAVHKIIEHEDGTITVSPSISIGTSPKYAWHGYLERGTWRIV